MVSRVIIVDNFISDEYSYWYYCENKFYVIQVMNKFIMEKFIELKKIEILKKIQFLLHIFIALIETGKK